MTLPNKIGYGFALFFIVTLLTSTYVTINEQNNTEDISITSDLENMSCPKDIYIPKADSAYSYDISLALKENKTLQDDICIMNVTYNNSALDRVSLFNLALKLEHWTIHREDIAQYFYRTIISTNPDDALSIHIKQQKLRE